MPEADTASEATAAAGMLHGPVQNVLYEHRHEEPAAANDVISQPPRKFLSEGGKRRKRAAKSSKKPDAKSSRAVPPKIGDF